MKLNKVIFSSILLSTLAVMVFSLVIMAAVMNVYFTNVEKLQLRNQVSLIGEGALTGGVDYLEAVEDDYRITWIAADGAVLFDSSADASAMDNHLTRDEVQQAIRYGTGESERFSDTISEKTVYEARRLDDGSIIRVSFTIDSVFQLTAGLIPYLLLIALVALLLCYLISRRLAVRIIRPLNTLDLDSPLENDAYEELSPLLVKIDGQKKQITAQLETLRHKAQEFSAITGNMSEGLVLLNEEGNIVSINRAALAILGAGDSCVGHSLLTVERSLEVQQLIAAAGSSGRSEVMLERNGRSYQFIASRIEEDGRSVGICLLIVDETDKAQAETMRREFSANVSHELKTPLHTILASSELLENNLVKDEDRALFVSRIHKEAEHLVTLVGDIISLSELDEREDFPVESVDMKALVSSVASSLEAEADEHNVRIYTECDDIKVNGVRRLLYEIVFNLADNAVRYNRDGGSVYISFKKKSGSLVLSVRDTGIGIAAEHTHRIFERFYRVDKSHSRATGGTGLGLSIVKHAVLIHKGDITVKSRVGEGTEIIVTFPLSMLD